MVLPSSTMIVQFRSVFFIIYLGESNYAVFINDWFIKLSVYCNNFEMFKKNNKQVELESKWVE